MTYRNWYIPAHVLASTEAAFRRGNHEVFALWTATLKPSGSDCEILRCVVPHQQPGVTSAGVFVHIPGAELSRIQVDNFHKGERSVAQLHTHPSEDVRMSELDRKWEVVTQEGSLSIIVPNYCRQPLTGFTGVNVYERVGNDWRLWSKGEIQQRIKII